ncbi:ArsR family transcriptional regulator [uncultured Ilyobacter sp.]|uniref:ArsR/SmtB family transcription factor n=1 Tax=uncultured Ilyobacter sp. TaxID=544433 RepID=UPI0029C7CBAD|nr:ArsR family transcriptional regulator [uncultured Ilyobacter sp.]
MDIKINSKNFDFFNALGSKTRLKIIEILIDGSKNIKEIAEILDISSTIVARHINHLEKAKIVETNAVSASRGMQKICKVRLTTYNLFFDLKGSGTKEISEYNIPVGHYKECEIEPTCGLATKKQLIGICDDPRYFSHPDRLDAGIIWFQSGWVEYIIPSYFFQEKKLKSIEISLELCSEFPGIKEDYPSDIYFEINGVSIGKWTAPGDFGKRKGKFTPKWWYLSEYGLLKKIKIKENGTFIDEIKISDISISELNISTKKDTTLRIVSPKATNNPGGINIFGRDFGDYNQDILVTVEY